MEKKKKKKKKRPNKIMDEEHMMSTDNFWELLNVLRNAPDEVLSTMSFDAQKTTS
jgi:hypothetical protein